MSAASSAGRRARWAAALMGALLLAGVVAGPPAVAADADDVVLSGQIRPEYQDPAFPSLDGDAFRVQAVDADSVVVEEIVSDASYSLSLPAGGSYAVRAEVIDDASWYPAWNAGMYGSSPIESDAARYSASAEVDIALPRTAPVSGTVTAAPAPGFATTDFVVQAWYSSASGDMVKLASMRTSGRPGVADPYSFDGDDRLPEGTYFFRIAEEGYPDYDDEYFEETADLDKYVYESLSGEGLTGIDFTPTAYASTVERIAGSDRYETASLVSRSGYGRGGPMYLASGADWPDALSAGPAASAQRGSLLLTDPGTLSDVIATNTELLDPSRIIVVGSSLSVSDDVLRSVDALTDAPVVRIGGKDRYDTSRRIVADAFPAGDHSTVFLATGTSFPDALSAAPIAGRRLEPVLLVDGADGTLDAPTRAAIDRLSAATGELLGGTPSISSGIEADLRASGTVEEVHRVAGADRYDTSRLLNDRYPPDELTSEVYVASGSGFADALAAGPVAAERGAPVYLSEPTCLPRATRIAMQGHDLDRVTLLGGTPTLSPALETLSTC